MNKLITDNQKACLRKAGYTETELRDLTVQQASALLHYVVQNRWQRPTQAQVEAIAAGELLEDAKAIRNSIPIARIPRDAEVEEITKDMSLPDQYQVEQGLSNLEAAATEEAGRMQGYALCQLRAACNHSQWKELVKAIGLSRVMADRLMRVTEARGGIDRRLNKLLEKRGVKFCHKVTCANVSPAATQQATAHADDSGDGIEVAQYISETTIELLRELPADDRERIWKEVVQRVEAEDLLTSRKEDVNARVS